MVQSELVKVVIRSLSAVRAAFWSAPLRLKILLAVLLLVLIAASVVKIQTWVFERQLWNIAEDIVARTNAEDLMVPDIEPSGTNTTCEVYVAYKYLVFGSATGKIVFLVSPLCTNEHRTKQDRLACFICSGNATRELDYIYLRGTGGWKFYESYMSHLGERR